MSANICRWNGFPEGDAGPRTTTSIDNGELSFLREGNSIVKLTPGDGSGHFPYVCFTGDATACVADRSQSPQTRMVGHCRTWWLKPLPMDRAKGAWSRH